MKRTSIYITFIAFAMASILSSCAFLQKGEFAQRKYYDFPRTKHNVNQASAGKQQEKATVQNIIVQEERKVAEPIIVASAKEKKIILNPLESNFNHAKNKKTNTIIKNDRIEVPEISFRKSEIRKQALQHEKHSPFREDAGLMLFLAIVAAIFIPPLGIYIKENWRITNWFWVTLILCIIAGGFLGVGNAGFGAISGLLWLTAAIIALLVVFDVL